MLYCIPNVCTGQCDAQIQFNYIETNSCGYQVYECRIGSQSSVKIKSIHLAVTIDAGALFDKSAVELSKTDLFANSCTFTFSNFSSSNYFTFDGNANNSSEYKAYRDLGFLFYVYLIPNTSSPNCRTFTGNTDVTFIEESGNACYKTYGGNTQACFTAASKTSYVIKYPPNCGNSGNNGLANVEVGFSEKLNHYLVNFTTTGSTGEVNVDFIQGGCYEYCLSKTSNPDCGLNGVDLTLMNNHITGAGCLTKTWELLAADLNEDNTVSIQDVVILQKLILGQSVNARTWKFINVPSNTFTILGQDYEAPCQRIALPSLPRCFDKPMSGPIDFVGLKSGDVDGSCNNCSFFKDEETDSRSIKSFALNYKFYNHSNNKVSLELPLSELANFPVLLQELKINLQEFSFDRIEFLGTNPNKEREIFNSDYDPLTGFLKFIYTNTSGISTTSVIIIHLFKNTLNSTSIPLLFSDENFEIFNKAYTSDLHEFNLNVNIQMDQIIAPEILNANYESNMLTIWNSNLVNFEMNLCSLNGSCILTQNINHGEKLIDISSLASGVYLINFKSDKGQIFSKKYIKL